MVTARDWAGVEWWNNPALAYSKGLDDGAKLGYEQAFKDIFDGFIEGLRGESTLREVTLKEAMERQIKAIEQDATRRAWDATANIPRPNDFKGRAA